MSASMNSFIFRRGGETRTIWRPEYCEKGKTRQGNGIAKNKREIGGEGEREKVAGRGRRILKKSKGDQ